MSLYKSAKELAAKGFFVFPIRENAKTPLVTEFTEVATDNANDLGRFWFDSVMEVEHFHNIGIATSKFHGGGALLVVDVDNKGDKKGSDTVIMLELQGFAFPKTLTQTTPTGGFHYIYQTKQPVPQGVEIFGKGSGIDTRSRGGYILGAGSLIDGAAYTIDTTPIAEAPKWLIEKCKAGNKTTTRKKKPLKKVSQKGAMTRARDYLLNQAPVAIEGAGGDQTTFRVAARLKDIGVSEDNCLDLMLDNWNDNCQPPWAPDELKEKIDNAYAYGQNVQGSDSPEADFDVVADDDYVDPVEELNNEFAYTIIGGKSAILRKIPGKDTAYLTVQTFRDLLKASTIQTGSGKRKQLTDLWFGSHKRKTYDYVELLPCKQAPPNVFNLWQGFAIEPLKSAGLATERMRHGLDLFYQHALENVCMGDKKLFNWLLGYFAHLVQKPWEKPQTALVFRGKKGVGKNALVRPIHSIFGDAHAMITPDKRHLIGNFNRHFETCVFIVFDEAFWSGDKQAEGRLKDLITGHTHLIEQKGREIYKVKNMTRVCVIGNEDWIVPATEDERRFAVFNVGRGSQQDLDFFGPMQDILMLEGGNRLLMRELLDFDLNTVNVNKAPATKGLLDQKVETLNPVHSWWLASLQEGSILNLDFQEASWPSTVGRELLRKAFMEYAKQRGVRSWLPDAGTFGRHFGEVMPNVETKRIREGSNRQRVCLIPPLEKCRTDFDTFIGHQLSWETESDAPDNVIDIWS